MLIRQTLLFLPAQLLPAAAQFASLALWSHLVGAAAIGRVTLMIAAQELLVTGLIWFWSQYVIRFGSAAQDDAAALATFNATGTAIIGTATVLLALAAPIIYLLGIDRAAPVSTLALVALMTAGRGFNFFQSERARNNRDTTLYTVEVASGPVIGLAVGTGLIVMLGHREPAIFAGYAAAQFAAAIYGVLRDSSWIARGRPDPAVVRRAWRYGAPLIFAAGLQWVTQNASRLVVNNLHGLAEAGRYAIGFGLGYRVTTMAAMLVIAAGFPLAARMANEGDHAAAMRQTAANGALLFAILVPVTIGLAMVAGQVVGVMIAPAARAGVAPVLVTTLVAGAFYCLRAHFVHHAFLLSGNTRPIAIVSAIEAALAVLFALVLVPRLGTAGGGIALAATSATALVIAYPIARRRGLLVDGGALARILAAGAIMAVLLMLVPATDDVKHLVLRVGVGGVAYPVALLALFGGQVRAKLRARAVRRTAGALSAATPIEAQVGDPAL